MIRQLRSPLIKHRWSIRHNYLAGITAGRWWKLLRDNRFAVDPVYWHRAAFITASSVLNSMYALREQRRYGDRIRDVQITQPPLFILGHWRSGTTLLHYLLAQDDQLFTFANTYQVINPTTFLTTEEVNSRRFAAMVPDTRPMDNMRLSFQTPQEDEFAPLLLTFLSPYLGVSFPRREEDYLRYLSLRDVPREDVQRWQSALLWFCKKLTLRQPRSLLLKSPPHTARIRWLLELFPDARFIHIHRHPYRVFQSQRHYFDTAMWYTYLQRPDVDRIDEGILRRCNVLYDAYWDDLPRVPEQQFCEVSFAALEADPVGEVARIYRHLRLPGWDGLQPKLAAYVHSLHGYRKNAYAPLTLGLRNRVAQQWRRNFEMWGYSTDDPEEEA
jgi:omega-hydroxy-beta-dihydromenaquinone-9 sulfotransferase